MKTIVTSIAASSLLAALAMAQPAPRYSIIELGPLGGTFSQANFVNDNRLVAGISTVRDGTQHAASAFQVVAARMLYQNAPHQLG